nr:MAG TPA: hypothetical protein [Caudoviricetes sp.]
MPFGGRLYAGLESGVYLCGLSYRLLNQGGRLIPGYGLISLYVLLPSV